MWNEAYQQNDRNLLELLEINPVAKILDVGCGDGKKSVLFKNKVRSKSIIGIDGVAKRLSVAKRIGVETKFVDIEKKWPFANNFFDVVISNQVIEHLVDLDHFIKEIKRVLKPGGYCVISTENLASWHNIFALLIGYQDFSHHLIKKSHIGNPLSPHYGEKTVAWSAPGNSGVDDTSFPHIKILTYISLRKIFEAYGFKFVRGLASGYYPLFSFISKIASRLNPEHSHFITIKMRKSET